LPDLLTDDARWADWSPRQLDAGSLRGPLMVDDGVYAEPAVRFATIETLVVTPASQCPRIGCTAASRRVFSSSRRRRRPRRIASGAGRAGSPVAPAAQDRQRRRRRTQHFHAAPPRGPGRVPPRRGS